MNKQQEHLGKEKINKLLYQFSGPAIIGMLAASLYNLVDTIFIGRGVGTLAIAGVSIAFPMQMIAMSLAIAIGIGASSIISRNLGSKDIKNAELTLGNFFSLVVGSGILILLIAFTWLDELMILFGASNEVLPYASQYTGILLFGTLPFMIASSANNIIRAEGSPKYAMLVMVLSIGLNIILDPIFIFVLDMGIRGAAIATVIAQILGAILVLRYFFYKKSIITLHFKNLYLKGKIVKEIITIGMSSFARQISSTIVTILLNKSLLIYGGDLAIAAFGVVHRLYMFILMPMFGIVQGFQPIAGFNYGAKKYSRVLEVTKLSIKVTTWMAMFAFLLIMLATKPLIMIFSRDQELIDLSVKTARTISWALPIIAFQVIASGLYQSLGKATPAFILSILRQTIVLIPLIIVLPWFFELAGIWYAFPIADIISAIITYIMLKREFKILKK